jgi:outer membrane protein assembly factor BamB
MTVDGFNLYVTTTQGHVYAVDRRSGLEKWGQLGLENRGLSAPVLFGEYLAVTDFEGYLHLLDTEQGNFVGQTQLDSDGYLAKPVVDHDLLYLLSKDGLLSAISIN